jgi:stage V sporulation protein SpoVS
MSQENESIRVGKNAKVSKIRDRMIKQLDQPGGLVRLEAVGAGAVNQALKAVAQARTDGYPLAVIPQLVEVPLGRGSQQAMHLLVFEVEL